MPNYYAHFKFGALVLECLPEGMGAILAGQREAFDLGCLGPDPLFFCGVLRLRNPARNEALRIHRGPVRPVALRLRQSVEQGRPMSRGYAAGFLCHLALDSACHSYVNQEAAKKGPSHLALEAGLDRLLMAEDGFKTPRLAGFPKAASDPAVYRAGAAAYVHANGAALKSGYRAMSLDARLLARLAGTGSQEVSAKLKTLMVGAVEETAAQVAGFLRGEPLGDWYDKDFNGGCAY